jgi:Sulfotransferase domain
MEYSYAAPQELVRTKPFIFGVGVEKCGTTSLHDFLSQAKNISVPFPKELEFFSTHYSEGLGWYLTKYDLCRDILLDFTPSYHWDVDAIQRIRHQSEVNVVLIMLRNPVERAYSAYVHRIYWFFERDFANRNIRGYDRTFYDFVSQGNEYIFPSYSEIIARVSSKFDDRSLINIILERLIQDPMHYVRIIEEKLGIGIQIPENLSLPKSNSLPVPQFARGRDIIDQYHAANVIKELDDVYFCRGGTPRRIASGDCYNDLKKLEQKWLEPASAGTALAVFEKYYAEETRGLEQALGVSLESWRRIRELHPRILAPISKCAPEIYGASGPENDLAAG